MSLTPDFIDTCRDQNILIIEPFYTTPVLETGLEVAELLSERNRVAYVSPNALRCVTDETIRFRTRLRIKLSRKRNVVKYLSDAVKPYRRDEIRSIERGLDVPDPAMLIDLSSGDLQGLKFENFDVGMGILSSLVSMTRDPHVDLVRHRDEAMAVGGDALILYRLTQHLIRSHAADIVILFNGRFASVRAIRRACEAMGTRYIVHERGSSINKYALFDCATPHQPEGIRHWVDTWWQAVDGPEAKARAFLDKRRNQIATDWYSFTRRQEIGHCPARDGRKRVVFFTSSEDELAAIGDELPADSPFCDQAHSIRSIGQACAERGYEYIVRFHPNTPTSSTALLATAQEVTSSVFGPSDKVDTYALIDSADIIFTQNSTVGIEAASKTKPAFYMGRNVFEYCRSVRRIKDGKDIAAALETSEPVDPLDAFKYANFFGEHGIPHLHYVPRGFFSGQYRGCDLNGPLFSGLRDVKLRLTRGGK